MQNQLKRRQVLSRDKSKRHSATMLEQKHNETLLERPEAAAEADDTPTPMRQDNSKNIIAKNLQRTGILTSSSQSQAFHSKSDEIMVMGHRLTPNQGVERNDSRSRSLSRSRFASAANNVNVRQPGDHYVGSDTQPLKMPSADPLDEG